jgi:hypothetical protein
LIERPKAEASPRSIPADLRYLNLGMYDAVEFTA